MSVSVRATSLPKLLSTLPRDGAGVLVRPSTSPNSIYRITRSNLKFRSPEAESGSEEGGVLSVSGKIWGMRFTNGKYQPHTKSQNPQVKLDSIIRERLTARWTQVTEEELSSEARAEIARKVEELAKST